MLFIGTFYVSFSYELPARESLNWFKLQGSEKLEVTLRFFFCVWPLWILVLLLQCSVPCGGGAKTRQVVCKKRLGNGTWVALPDDQCRDVTSNKPHSSMRCNSMPCHKWRVLYPCVSCGGKFDIPVSSVISHIANHKRGEVRRLGEVLLIFQ